MGYSTSERGAIEPMRIDKWLADLDAARRSQSGNRIAAWALGDREARTINPFTKVTRDEYIQRRLETGSADARETPRLFPWVSSLLDKGVIR